MISIKVDLKNKDDKYNIEHIKTCLDIIISIYMEKKGSLEDAEIFIPSAVYKIMAQKCSRKELKEKRLKSFYGWVKLIEDRNSYNIFVIIDKKRRKIIMGNEFTHKEKKLNKLLIEALDLINELDENIGIETNNSFTMDFETLRKKTTDMIDLIKG